MIGSNKEKYWADRASKYSEFKWARDTLYLKAFIGACDFKKDDFVLDLGCGPGIVSRAALPHVGRLIGMDNSKEMLLQCDREVNFLFGDANDIPFPPMTFDKILARNVFHHITKDGLRSSYGLLEAIRECRRVLVPGGRLIMGERIPPSDETEDEYKSMISFKDDREIYTEKLWGGNLKICGFKVVNSFPVWIRGVSVRDWLMKSGLTDEIKERIWDRHVNCSPEFRIAHNMTFHQNQECAKKGVLDIKIDIKNAVIVGEKR